MIFVSPPIVGISTIKDESGVNGSVIAASIIGTLLFLFISTLCVVSLLVWKKNQKSLSTGNIEE
jgi:putative effector of murein hydrolase LrgA (UPF0299 family)